ncbi:MULTISPECIES: response regulator [Brevibacillus]|uniref:Response regulator receiver and SARP domain-containing protein n=3 Tax=Brevibacillus borstelensis TaxID=45462 RepID=M8DED5_9BACL|nr:response regulator [Brevibacillus borstelensis]EMT51762.1 response regulator receiver and SARP domain-containing protein [Brevibacillus borstelensis AK1]KKX56154.1 response regulator receiver protein [Brevibacillus borstelensis cifa_chp40]MCC0564031.1 response regulator [Brevibacillus borstelensis]MCM3470237.1 response regulator [Brevibacillus borstelensis]MCM3558174.1 response regulator [Brevibacillus borstelensis]
MKAIIVDDERLALRRMEKLLKEQNANTPIHLMGSFQDPHAALEAAKQEKLDVAFLDIQMIDMDGFELAEHLLNIQPQLHIVFVTAFQEYAVKAFEMNALDYLLKPVHQGRLAVTLQRVAESAGKTSVSYSSQKHMTLCCLQSLHYLDQQGNEQYLPWKTLKGQELFAYLVHYRDKTVSKQVLIDLLWPDYDSVRSRTQLHTAIYQIRKMIKSIGFDLEIKYKDEGYRLVWGDVKLDVEEWEALVRDAPKVTEETLEQHLSIMAKYTGDFLEEHPYLWAEYEQERLRLLWLNHVKQIAEYYVSVEQYTEAILIYQKIREKFPVMEEGYFYLMKIYAMLNHQGEVSKQFKLISTKLREEFDVAPSKELTEWYEQWKKGDQT